MGHVVRSGLINWIKSKIKSLSSRASVLENKIGDTDISCKHYDNTDENIYCQVDDDLIKFEHKKVS